MQIFKCKLTIHQRKGILKFNDYKTSTLIIEILQKIFFQSVKKAANIFLITASFFRFFAVKI